MSLKNLQILSVGDFEIKEWKNKIGSVEASFWTIISRKKVLVFGKEFATTVGFTNTNKAINDHIDPEDITTIVDVFGKDFKMTLKQYFQGGNESLPPLFFQNLQPHQKLLSKPAIYALCINSKLPEIKPFRRWVYDLIDKVLDTGSYNLLNMQNLSIEETPVEKVESTFKFIPNFEFNGDNTERKEFRKVYKEGGDLSVDLKKSRDGSLGGTEKDRRDKSRIKLLLKIFKSKENLRDENLRKELEEIVINQNLLEIKLD